MTDFFSNAGDKYEVWARRSRAKWPTTNTNAGATPLPCIQACQVQASETKEKAQGVDQDTELQLSSGGGLVGL